MSKVPEVLLGDQVLLEGHLSDDVVLTTEGGVLATFEVAGVFPETANDSDAETWFDALHNGWRNIAAEDIELTIYQVRGEAYQWKYQTGPHHSSFAKELDTAYRDSLSRGTLWFNRIYLVIQIHAPGVATRRISDFFRDTTSDPRAGITERHDRLNQLCDILRTQLGSFGLRRLGYTKRGHVIFDEIAEAIVFSMTGVYRQIGATTGRMGHAMFSEAIQFRRDRIEIANPIGTSHAVMLALKDYPASSSTGMFHDLAVAPYRHTLAQSFRFLSLAEALSVVGRKQHKMLIAGDKAVNQASELEAAAGELLERKWVLGDHSLVVISFADDLPSLPEVSNATWRDLAACGIIAVRMTKALRAAYLSLLPSGLSLRPRPGFIKSRNLVGMAPLYNWPVGDERGHWGGPIAIFRTLAGTPFLFHWQVRDVGNTLFTGMPGAGKTLTTGFLIAMSGGRARIVALDHKKGWKFLIERMNGDYAVLGSGVPSFAPLKALSDNPRDIGFLTGLIRGCIADKMTTEEDRRLSLGLSIIMTLPSEDRSIRELRAFFDDAPEGAGARLDKWCHGNELGWCLDAPYDTVRFGRLTGLDTTALLDNPRARGPCMSYLFHRIELLLDGSPILIPMDEGWRALQDATFRANIEKQLRTIRSKGGAIVFITQSPHEIIDSTIANLLVEMCPTQFHLANPRGTREDYVDKLKLTEGQWNALRGIQLGSGLFLLIQGDKSVVAQLPLDGMDPNFIATLSAREEELTRVNGFFTEEYQEAAE